ncbi:IclR family transcriptional regulator [Actinomadura sp. NBRC 104412]|uniref:IclR family transcriptional regulator n=1 Tax=Actinomadura sp. NBRC 104412 TaxID=3032203 RepID=UPI0024A5DBE1|nr:IclR family transcriptional regulator [Actinomadura sp. NBRC 104412]GLZ06543.1 IclR family transcriptional regulator [Actinomadura sp. NBRC 104412]
MTSTADVGEVPVPKQERNGGRGGGQTTATVERAADVLMFFAEQRSRTLGVTEVANALKLSKAAVHRILTSLRRHGLIELDESSRRYSLGIGAMKLGMAYLERMDVRTVARPELVALSERTAETATLSVRSGWTRSYIDQVTPRRELIMSVTLGVPYPLHAGASSKAFLAFLPDEEIEHYLSQPSLEQLTPATITNVPRLRREIEEIRARGHARSTAERQAGAASVAAPILDQSGRPIAVVSVSGPIERFLEDTDAHAAALLRTTRLLSERFGHRPE